MSARPRAASDPTAAEPVWPDYFADPAVIRLPDGNYAAYGTATPQDSRSGRVFECLLSDDLATWRSVGPTLERLPAEFGDEYWAPEVVRIGATYWMYYSVGHGIQGHHLRVARSVRPAGPFRDLGVNLTPSETFAIDPHPFQDRDGQWYLYFARDVLDHPRPGTHLAVAPMVDPAHLGATVPVLAPGADWQLYERNRSMYGRRYDWHTLEGPFVVRRLDRYWLTYSGGAWTGPGYAVSWAVADHPLGPWQPAPADAPALLHTDGHLIGPGHNSIVRGPDGDVIAFHAWDAEQRRRQLHLRPIRYTAGGPVV